MDDLERKRLEKEGKKQSALSYLFHYWLNDQSEVFGDAEKQAASLIKPHANHWYSFKSMIESLGYLEHYLRGAFTNTLRQHHQQCLRHAPEPLKEKNKVVCALGKDVTECPILLSLKKNYDEHLGNSAYYKEAATPDDVFVLMARTCGWHMLHSEVAENKHVDWNEGAVQDVSDRQFWNNVYSNLADGPQTDEEVPPESMDPL